MFKLRDVLAMLVSVAMLLSLLTMFSPYLPQNVRDRHLEDLHTQADLGASPVITIAIDQTMACWLDVLHRDDRYRRGMGFGPTWQEQRLVVWDPCVQQGELRLRLQGDEIPEFLRRLEPIAAFVQKTLERS